MVARADNNNRIQGKQRPDDTRGRQARRADRSGEAKKADISDTDDDFLASLCYGDVTDGGAPGPDTPRPGVWMPFLHLLIAPRLGWRDIKAARFRVEDYARTLFYPLLALMAACRFVDMFYFHDAHTGTLLQKALAAFVAGFAGYHLVCLLARTILPAAGRIKIAKAFGHIYILTVMSVLAVTMTLSELLPWLGAMLIVLPIYAAYIMVKGVRLLRVPDEERTLTAVIMTMLCMGVPSIIYFLLELVMPPA